jgi:uncharacterized membrane protein
MYRSSWLLNRSSAPLALVAIAILGFAWPMENIPACVVAAVMLALAAAVKLRAHFYSPGYGQ